MLKRPRPPSPPPTRPDPSSPPPLDNNALPIAKRRRIAGPIIDSDHRREGDIVDDGEDDYEDDESCGTSVDILQGKAYEHVNHFLHGLHAEHRHRTRAVPSSSIFADSQSSHPHTSDTFLSHRDYSAPSSSPAAGPTKYSRNQAHPSSISSTMCRGLPESRGSEDDMLYGSDRLQDDDAYEVARPDEQDDERVCVTHRYEDTNRLLGSLVLSRRRMLVSSSIEPE